MQYLQELRDRVLDPKITSRSILELERDLCEILFFSKSDGAAVVSDIVTGWKQMDALDKRRKNWLLLVSYLWADFDYSSQGMWLDHLRATFYTIKDWESAFIVSDFLGTNSADDRCLAVLMDLPDLASCEEAFSMIPNGWRRAAGLNNATISAIAEVEVAKLLVGRFAKEVGTPAKHSRRKRRG